MKARRRRYIHIHIAVMNPVKPPQQRYLVVEQMPQVEHEIQKNDGDNGVQPGRHIQQRQYPEVVCGDKGSKLVFSR